MLNCCAHAIVTACEAKDKRIAELEARPESQQVADATRDRALELLRRLLARIDKHGGYSKPDQQADVRSAKALIAEQAGKR